MVYCPDCNYKNLSPGAEYLKACSNCGSDEVYCLDIRFADEWLEDESSINKPVTGYYDDVIGVELKTMEKQLEDLLWLRASSLTYEVRSKIYSLIREVCQLSPSLSDDETVQWISDNYNDIYLIARDRPKWGDWICTIEQLNKELANLGILN